MKRSLSVLPAAAPLVLTLILSGSALAGHSTLAGRVGRSDAQKVAAQRADADRWLNDDQDWGDRDREHYRELRDVAWKASTGTLEVDGGENGGAIVTGWSKDSIRVIARIQTQARTEERARDLANRVRIVSQGGTLSAEGPDTGDNESWSVVFDMLVPRAKALRFEAENGPVCVGDMNAKLDLKTVNGPMVLNGVAGDVHARTQNGPLSVSLTGSRWSGAGLDATTENGPLTLAVPRGYSCMLETGTINGPMSMSIPIVVQGNFSRQHVSTKLGSGGPTVRATTINGPAVVHYAGEERASD